MPLYRNEDHGYLSGLSDDDHLQYIHNTPTTSSRNLITNGADIIGLSIKKNASQTAYPFEIQDSSGTRSMGVTSAGQVHLVSDSVDVANWQAESVLNIIKAPVFVDTPYNYDATSYLSGYLSISQITLTGSGGVVNYFADLNFVTNSASESLTGYNSFASQPNISSVTDLDINSFVGFLSSPTLNIGTGNILSFRGFYSTYVIPSGSITSLSHFYAEGLGTASSELGFYVTGTLTYAFRSDSTGISHFNAGMHDADFIIDGDNVSNLFFVDASTDRIGIRTNNPAVALDVDGTSSSYTDGLSLVRYGIGRFTRTNTASLSGSESDGQVHLELNLNPSSAYGGLACNTLTSFLLISSGNAQNFTTTGMRSANFTFRHMGTGTVSAVNGIASGFGLTSTGTITTLLGINAAALNSGGGTITLLESIRVSQPSGRTSGSPNSTWTTIYGINIQDQTPTGASNTVTNAPIALKIQNQTGSGAYGIQMGTGLNYFAGSVRIGSTTAPTNALDVTGTATASVQVTTPIVSGGTASGNTLTLKSNDTTWPRTSYTQTDHLIIGQSYTYPTGSAATLYAVQIAGSISSIDVSNPTINTMNIVPTWTYTTGQSWGLVVKAALNFVPNVTSAVGAGGTDSCIYAGVNTQPQLDISSGSRTWTNFWGIAVDPRNVGTSGTITAMIGVRTRGSLTSGTTATAYSAFTSDFSSVSGSTVTTFYGTNIAPTLAGTTTNFYGHQVAPSITGTCTNFYGYKVTDSSTPSGDKIAFYHSGTNAHSRFQGRVRIGADSAPSYPLHVTGSIASSSLTSGRVPYATTNGELVDDGFMTYSAGTLNVSTISASDYGSFNLVSIAADIYEYNGAATTNGGVPCIRAQVNLTAQSAAVGATTLYTPGTSGIYIVDIYLKVTRAATTSSTLGNVVIGFTDPTDSVAQSVTCQLGRTDGNSGSTYIGNNTTTVLQGKCVIHAKAGVAITYAIGYTSSGATTMQYKATLRLEELL